MFIPVALAAALSVQAPAHPVDDASRGLTQGIVRICDHEFDCAEFDAADVERQAQPNRSLPAPGQMVFLDPHTGQIAEPTREQLEELHDLIVLEELAEPSREPLQMEALADGTVKVGVWHLAPHMQAVILSARETGGACPARAAAAREGRP